MERSITDNIASDKDVHAYPNCFCTMKKSLSISKMVKIQMSSTYFAKVFDKDDHGILLHKLRALGIDGLLRRWIHSFLMDRTQRISIQGELSDQSEVQSEVPQG